MRSCERDRIFKVGGDPLYEAFLLVNPVSIDRTEVQHYCLQMAGVSQIQKNLRAAMKDALRIQDRFVPEPVFAKTGRGYLKSEGVTTLHKIKAGVRHSSSSKPK